MSIAATGSMEPQLPAETTAAAAQSALSWGAVLGGAFIMAIAAVTLTALGVGLGLSSISPWPGSGVSATTFTIYGAVWLIVVQWLSAALGAYVAGRLRTRWTDVHTDEVTFRDTAHGLLAWSVASLVGILLLASAASSVLGGATSVAASAAGSAAGNSDPNAYFVDSLYRGTTATSQGSGDPRPEAGRILAVSLKNGSISPDDKTYLAQSIETRTGISQADAERRVDAAVTDARALADAARKNTVKVSIYLFLSMLIGAFIAAVAGAEGGRARDDAERYVRL